MLPIENANIFTPVTNIFSDSTCLHCRGYQNPLRQAKKIMVENGISPQIFLYTLTNKKSREFFFRLILLNIYYNKSKSVSCS